MMIALKSFSDTFNVCHFGVGIYWLPFLIHFRIFLILDVTSYFLSQSGHLGYFVIRVINDSCYVELCSFSTLFGESFCMKGCWILSNAFFSIIFFSLLLFNVVYHSDWFVYVEPSLKPWNESSFIILYDPFNIFLD